MLALLLALVLCVVLHLLAMAATGLLLGMELRELSIGIGPSLKFGRLRAGLLPIGGAVRFRLEDEPDMEAGHEEAFPPRGRAFDTAPAWMRLCVVLSGCATLLLAAFALAPGQALHDFLVTPAQLYAGISEPTEGAAHAMLAAGIAFARAQPFGATFALVAAKLAAFNLLPFFGSNGSAVLALIARALGWKREPPQGLLLLWFFATIALLCLWVYGIVLYLSARPPA
jgi:membrane-associated protease RseP (regulator of RpoE activity)